MVVNATISPLPIGDYAPPSTSKPRLVAKIIEFLETSLLAQAAGYQENDRRSRMATHNLFHQ